MTSAQAKAARDRVRKNPPPSQPQQTNGIDLAALCLSPADWEARDIPEEETLLGPFSKTTRGELAADTGLGKTMLGLARSTAISTGQNFLHWRSPRAGRVLYIDGEMPPGLIQTRLQIARAWFEISEPLARDRFVLLSTADVEEYMPPLDTPEGERWLLNFIEQMGGFDDITFDNRACLVVGEMSADDASTRAIKHLQRQLTRQSIGQFWLHHTGYDTTRGYGRKAREWELDYVMIGEKTENRNGADVAMTIRFTKSRRRTPDNRADYEPVELELSRGIWTFKTTDAETATTQATPLGRNQKIVRDAATKLLAASTKQAPGGHPAGGHVVITLETLEDEVRKTFVCEAKRFPSRFGEALNGLTNAKRLHQYAGLVWLP
jgi:hypothetical protein